MSEFHSEVKEKIFICLSCATAELSHHIYNIPMGICKCPDRYQPCDHTVACCKLVHLPVFDLAMTDMHRPFMVGIGMIGTAMFLSVFVQGNISIRAFRVRVRVRLKSGLELGLGLRLGLG